jgi:hypothetical protein
LLLGALPANQTDYKRTAIFTGNDRRVGALGPENCRSFIRTPDTDLPEREGLEVPEAASSPAPEVDFHIVEVNFNALLDDGERRYFNSLPTNLELSPDAVDRLREVAGRLLRQSADWKKPLQGLQGSEANGSPGSPVGSENPK